MNPSLEALIARAPVLAACRDDLQAALDALVATFADGGTLYVCGNGGSAADSEHLVGELMKSFERPRPIPSADRAALFREAPEYAESLANRLEGALPAVSLASQTALLTAVANDVAADLVFAQQVYGYGRRGDALLAISTSGTSASVIHAAAVARSKGMRTVALTGRGGGALAPSCDVSVRVPEVATARVQELHLPVLHAWCAALETRFFGGDEEGEEGTFASGDEGTGRPS